jgi:hypothetical protein
MFVRAVTARNALVLFSHGSDVEIYQWTTDTAGHVSTQVEDMDELVSYHICWLHFLADDPFIVEWYPGIALPR